MLSKHQSEASSKQSSSTPSIRNPSTSDLKAQAIKAMQRALSDGSAVQEPVAGPSGYKPERLTHLALNASTTRAGYLRSYSPVGTDQAKAFCQDLRASRNKAMKAVKPKKITESIEMEALPGEVTCAGDLQLQQIASFDDSSTAPTLSTDSDTEQQCWVFLPICGGRTTVYDCVVGFFTGLITCAPLRYICRNVCEDLDASDATSASFEREAAEYMDRHPRFAEDYLEKHVPLEVVERIYLSKIEEEQIKSPERKDFNNLFLVGKPDYMHLIDVLNEDITIEEILIKLAEEIAIALKGDAFRIYRVFPANHLKIMEVYVAYDDPKYWLTVSDPETECMEALRRNSIMCFTQVNKPLNLSNTLGDVFTREKLTQNELTHKILIPTFGNDAELSYLFEIWKDPRTFRVADVEIAKSYMIWGSFAITKHLQLLNQRRFNKLNTFLFKSIKSVFEDVHSMDQVLKRTLEYAQELVDADRASLFMIDNDRQELVSRVFDLGGHDSSTPSEMRIPINRGIAGYVALTGETVNIADAYSDSKFNHKVDDATGYRTTSILCMPVKVDKKVIGVVQLINKRSDDHFRIEDERSLRIFSVFFGLALHNAGVYDIIARNEQKYRVALDVLSYHNTCRENEVLELQNLEPLPKEIRLNDFYLDPFKFNPLEKCQAVIAMFHKLFNLNNFNHTSLTRFVLTVKKNYREVPYHNFHHGWSVAQSMYAILKADAVGRFSYKQRLALFVASLCHDLDHRGFTNQYMSETASPLASMYTTSTLEHHHFNITVTILQQDGHNIFDRFSSEEFKEMLGLIKTCILATDLAAFFPNLAQLKVECNNDYDWSNNEHSKLAMALSMTAADLSAAAKPWEVQIETVMVIFQEFYDQGDKERIAGRKPIPMMDRDKPQEQPASQVGFLTSICLPCYGMLKKLLPSTDKMFLMAVKNLEIWQQKATDAAQATKTDLVEAGDSSIHSFEDADLAKAGDDSPFSNEGITSMTGSDNKDVLQTLGEIRGNDDEESHVSGEEGDNWTNTSP